MTAHWIKTGDLWQLNISNIDDVSPPKLYLPATTRGNIVPPRSFLGLPPGTYYPPGGLLLVPPRKRIGRFLRMDIRNNEKQMDLLDAAKQTLLSPAKRQKPRGRRPRPTRVIIELPEDLPIDYIFNPHNGSAIQISVNGRIVTPLKVTIENFYQKTKREKIINKFVYEHGWAFHEANVAIGRYDSLYAIDTNTTRHKSGRLLSVSVVYAATVQAVDNGLSMFEAAPFRAQASLHQKDKPEMEGWVWLIDELLPMLDNGTVRRIGIVVDSELGILEGLNARTTPLTNGCFLPAGIEFIYATDSAGTDQFAVNKLISSCDKLSAHFAQRLKTVEPVDFSEAVSRASDSVPGV